MSPEKKGGYGKFRIPTVMVLKIKLLLPSGDRKRPGRTSAPGGHFALPGGPSCRQVFLCDKPWANRSKCSEFFENFDATGAFR